MIFTSTIKRVVAALLLTWPAVPATAAADADMPKMRVIQIDEPVTQLVVDILPGRGVKCIFPWVLDERAQPTPARSVITNDAVFEQIRGAQQNAIEYRIKAQGQQLEGEVCDAFVSAEGFHFAFTLRVNFSKRAHYSTILFELGAQKKYQLISEAIQAARADMEQQRASADSGLDERVKKQSLLLIAKTILSRPKRTNVFEKEQKRLANGDTVLFRADQIFSYGDIHILKINVRNDSRVQPLYITGIQIEKTSGAGQALFCQHEIASRIDPGDEADGFVVTRDPRMVDAEDTKMTLHTDQGEVVLAW